MRLPGRSLLPALLSGLLLAVSCLLALPAAAQNWPARQPIRFIVPYPPGGASDVTARVLGPNAINPAVYSKLPFDPIRDFTPITLTSIVPLVVLVTPSLPVKSMAVIQMLIVSRLNSEIVRILKLPDVAEKLSSLGADIVGSSPEEFAHYLDAEIGKWRAVARASHVQLE